MFELIGGIIGLGLTAVSIWIMVLIIKALLKYLKK